MDTPIKTLSKVTLPLGLLLVLLLPTSSCRILEPFGWKMTPEEQLQLRLLQSYSRKRQVHGFDLGFELKRPDIIVIRVQYSPAKHTPGQVRVYAEGAEEMAKRVGREQFQLNNVRTEVILEEIDKEAP